MTCDLCPHRCNIAEGALGLCQARRAVRRSILPDTYGKVSALLLDPVEKKPLAMFFPGRSILSVGSYGCNMRCGFCQNYDISMHMPAMGRTRYLSPEELAQQAASIPHNIGIAFTYNEPLIGLEYVLDSAHLVRERGMKTVAVTNGMLSEPYHEALFSCIDALNIDLKGFTDSFYRELGGDLRTVLRFIENALQRCHVEITTLIVPGKNDDPAQIGALCAWLAAHGNVPLHLTRYFPHYQCEMPATPLAVMHDLAAEARKHLSHVFLGNCG